MSDEPVVEEQPPPPKRSRRKSGAITAKKAAAVPALPAKDLMKGRRHDWEAIRTAYIEGFDPDGTGQSVIFGTLAEVAERFNVTPERVREMSARERWPTRRNAHQLKMATEARTARLRALSSQSVEFDERTLTVAKIGMGMVTARLTEVAEELKESKDRRAKAMAKRERGEPVERHELYSAVNYREMEGLAKAAVTFQDIGRRALGTDIDRLEITGADGGAIQMEGDFSIREELGRDDPERLAQILMAAHRAGITQALSRASGEPVDDDDDIMDAELVDDEPAIGA